jgi:hypothetical protein
LNYKTDLNMPLNRREMLRATGFAAAGALCSWKSRTICAPLTEEILHTSRRPEPSKRRFTSEIIESKIQQVADHVGDPELAWMFQNCFPNTLDTTVEFGILDGRPDTFVITGDINAMWLRDSSAQVWPYLPLAKEDRSLQRLLAGVINRQTRCILLDPYANAFNYGLTGSEWDKDRTLMKPGLHERKWEIDSLCYPIRLAHGYWLVTGDTSCFNDEWLKAMTLVVKTFREQQRLNGPGPYSFERVTSRAIDTVPLNGFGNPARPCGLIHSAFRPSDDACIYPFLIPSNLFAIVSLKQLAEIISTEMKDKELASECRALAQQISEALEKYAKASHPKYGSIYAYEVDGFGNRLFMDDANVPSLLALPYLGCCAPGDRIYKNTRAFVLSTDNPYFFRGPAGEGVGGPHVGLGMIWPLGIIMRALTSTDDQEITSCLRMLKSSHAGTGFMHEAFSANDAQKFTRPWFAWANTLFGELILKLNSERLHLLKSQLV